MISAQTSLSNNFKLTNFFYIYLPFIYFSGIDQILLNTTKGKQALFISFCNSTLTTEEKAAHETEADIQDKTV